MPLKKMVACLTTGLLMSFCSTATQLRLGIGLPALVAGRRTSPR